MTIVHADTSQKNPNPQGKGVVPVLRDWSTMQPVPVGPKSSAVFLRDYCLSSLILSADFRFKPVVGNTYYLYARGQDWSLSLIGPAEWGQRMPGDFLAACMLRTDMTWEMNTAILDERSEALESARNFIREFMDNLSQQDSICSNLPFYDQNVPYYQRMLGTALASSLQMSLPARGDDMKSLLADYHSQVGVALLEQTPA